MKRIVLCCDGTWNRLSQASAGSSSPTNVVKLAFDIAHADANGTTQVVNYDEGVGLGNIFDRLLGGAFGAGLDEHIFEAYRFLIANYERGDEIFLFGFSRGAYTARSIAGMIRKCGILRPDRLAEYGRATELYRSRITPDDPTAREFRADASIGGDEPIPIKMIGVWDTVGALGIPVRGLRWTARRFAFHDTELSGTIEHAYHALAVDERRDSFVPTLWTSAPKPNQKVEQVWFCGTHSDVGGGFPGEAFSTFSLCWMKEKASSAGLAFNSPLSPPLGSPFPQGGINHLESMLRGWLLGRARTIDGGGTNESLHPSVLARWAADPTYRPPSLARYFAVKGPPVSAPQRP